MRTTLDIDKKLIEEAERLTGESSPSKAITRVIEEYVRWQRRELLLAALGTRDLELDDWNEFRHAERS